MNDKKMVKVQLNKDHTHAGVTYQAGEDIEVSEKRREYFRERGWIKGQEKAEKSRT